MHRLVFSFIALLIASSAFAGGPALPYRFTIQGDTQDWARITGQPALWLETNRAICAQPPSLLIGTGDIVNNTTDTAQWQAARNAFDVLRACNLPFATPAGNHDYDFPPGTPNWSFYDAFLAAYPPPSVTRSATGRSWLQAFAPGVVLAVLPYGADAAEVTWLESAIAARTQSVVLVQHEAIEPSAWVFSSQVQHLRGVFGARIVGVIGGHYLQDDRVRFEALPTGGFALYSNWQWSPTAGTFTGWVTQLEYRSTTGQWCISTQNMRTGARDLMETPKCV
jgi:hypothetical protein